MQVEKFYPEFNFDLQHIQQEDKKDDGIRNLRFSYMLMIS